MLSLDGLFNESFYLANNPDVEAAIAAGQFTSGMEHFNLFGEMEQRNPSALFDRRYYLTNNPDVADAVNTNLTTAVKHFLTFGQTEQRNPSTLFNSSQYLAENSDVAAAVGADAITGIQHFVQHGQFEDRRPSHFYNDSYYLAQNPDVAEAVNRDELTGIQHYLQFGAIERREFTPFIEPGGSTLPNGVAAGDVTQTSAVLWTRTIIPGAVSFEYSTDPNFGSILGSLNATAIDPTVPVKVELTGLNPNTDYFYRVTDVTGTSATGKFSTSAPLGTREGVTFGVSGDWQGHLTPYPAISNAPSRNLDFFVGLGDTAYVDDLSPDLPGIRQPDRLDEFQTKHNEVYSERFGLNTLADLRASTPIYVTWDDHEITNDFAGGAAAADSPQRDDIFGSGSELVNDTPVFDDALTALKQYNPLRDELYGDTGDPRTANETKLYRYNTHGSDAATFLLDVRSFRDAPLPFLPETSSEEEINQYLTDAFESDRTMLGAAQLQELKDDLLAAENNDITWKFILSSVPMQYFGIPVAGERWEGYAAERTELLRFINDNDIENVVFVTGDFHGHVVNNLTYQDGFGQPQIQTSAIDVQVGPIAYQLNLGEGAFGAPFGPATVVFTPNALLPQSEKDRYNALTDRDEKNTFVRQVVDNRIVSLGYPAIGLENTNIDAQLLQGQYIGAHNFGWTEFSIDPTTQQLTVTTYGVDPYSQPEIEANPSAIANQTPEIITQFLVNPT